ncbi:DUF3576 domain-containing protein [Candidatus Pelagibacter ubique]|jgi:hypothetical protein|nr:DUF3576 domain-containing protein [Candidatus Pelagibacter ubique]
MNFLKFFVIFTLILSLSNCSTFRKVDTRKVPVNVNERAEKNIQEGRGFRVMDLGNKSSGTFEFATSNEMWRASLDILDFTPLSNVNYSGGVIITDWYSNDNSKNEYLKITIRFLSNEIRSDALKVTIYKKTCTDNNACSTKKISSDLSDEIKKSILRNATMLKEKERVVDKNYKIPSIK